MYLYSLTLQQPTAIQKAIYGNFSSPKAQEIVVSRGKILELMRPDPNSGKLLTILSQEIFGIIRNLIAFRLTGSNRDYIIVTSDSGRVVVLQFENDKNQFIKVHQETYGKTGVRRIVPGQFLAVDPKGRAFMMAAIEKQKFVYIMNRDSQAKLTISSPLEAHKSHALVFDICGVDVGYENPLFACIEVDYGAWDQKDSNVCTGEVQKFIIYYEMDLGLNHVVRKNPEKIPSSAHMLIPIPGLPEGPGGYIVCCENFLIYKNLAGSNRTVPFPTRIGGTTDRKLIINCYATLKQKDFFFFLLQTELGDLLKLSLSYTDEEVHGISLQYFDSIPVCNSLCILKTGHLFGACEFGNHQFYTFSSIGDNEKNPIITDSTMQIDDLVPFAPRKLTNLQLLEELENLSSISDIKIDDLTGEGHPQIYTLCAANSRSSLRILRHGLAVVEQAVSQLPGKPLAIWTIKETIDSEFHQFIVLSFMNQTLVLSIGEKVVEVSDSGLEGNKSTLHVNLMEDNAIIQVNPNSIRHVRKDKRINQWQTDGKIIQAASNQRQLIIALLGGELIYFELNQLGQLAEMEKITLDVEVVALNIGAIPEERQRCKFLAVAMADFSVKLFSLDPESCLQRLHIQALPAMATSVNLLEMKSENIEENDQQQLYLHVGLENGVLLRAAVDPITGSLSDTRTRFLGSSPVKLFSIQILKQPALLALSSRPWIYYNYLNKFFMVPLSYDTLDYASSFNSNECTDGIVGISSNSLRIIQPEKQGEQFNQTVIPLRYSPRKMEINPQFHTITIIESDHRAFCEKDNEEYKKLYYQGYEETLQLPDTQIGRLKAPEGVWGSCIRILEPIEQKTLELIELENNESAISMCIVQFEKIEELCLVVGVVKDFILVPKSFTCCFVYVYQFIQNGQRLELVHKTLIDDMPYCFAPYKGKLLIGVGNMTRMYELGKKKLLKKAELKGFQAGINSLQVMGERIFATDLADSLHILKYKPKEQTFFEYADDVIPRWVTSCKVLDYHTIIAGDKFENMFVLRLPNNMDEDIDEDQTSFYKFRSEQGYLNGAYYKMDQICNFYVGELITSIQKAALVSTSNEVVIYGSSLGAIGAFYAFETKEDVDFFVHLEMYLRIEALPLCGRDHLLFRSFYGPVRNVIDGDLCEQFSLLNYNKQKILGEELDRTPAEVLKKLEDIRNRIL